MCMSTHSLFFRLIQECGASTLSFQGYITKMNISNDGRKFYQVYHRHPSAINLLPTSTFMRGGHLSTIVPLYPCFAMYIPQRPDNKHRPNSKSSSFENLEGAEHQLTAANNNGLIYQGCLNYLKKICTIRDVILYTSMFIGRRYMDEMLQIRHKTICNQSIICMVFLLK